MNRRDFLRGIGGILAAGVAPAFIGSDVLMPVKNLWMPSQHILWGDGVRDDTAALQALVEGDFVTFADGSPVINRFLRAGTYRVTSVR